ncbi:carboxypeptidase-like regulatory domain-containing protein [Catalinimonas sp. 4WD22]|uniref:carboxypeptidase-like regulatory domain-containing protein n=1 Tax=Catalinimonas locisalis TaxID=3133978 RepID=UPI0031011401
MFRYLIVILFLTTTLASAQEVDNLNASDSIQISGVVINADSLQQIPNANILINNQPLGFATDTSGYFSIFAQPYDTITFTSIGYREGKFVVPEGLQGLNYSLVETLVPDTMMLDEVTIYPLPTADEFVESFQDLSLIYTDKYEAMRDNIERIDTMEDEELFLSKYQPVDINFGYGRMYNNEWGPIPANNFLNPAQWSRFINDLQELNLSDDNLE